MVCQVKRWKRFLCHEIVLLQTILEDKEIVLAKINLFFSSYIGKNVII